MTTLDNNTTAHKGEIFINSMWLHRYMNLSVCLIRMEVFPSAAEIHDGLEDAFIATELATGRISRCQDGVLPPVRTYDIVEANDWDDENLVFLLGLPSGLIQTRVPASQLKGRGE